MQGSGSKTHLPGEGTRLERKLNTVVKGPSWSLVFWPCDTEKTREQEALSQKHLNHNVSLSRKKSSNKKIEQRECEKPYVIISMYITL